ncbi:ISL3 family transposase [Arcticibacter eurypsychrophilus]|uniref:ISL3 family transposase n=1 Tax=Arcticibacter eurypsychrophilus TaxID=1434752 RepID=UPI00293722C5|nr:ISL3 family transposase [Arcticibacter eurypsychrophilus]
MFNLKIVCLFYGDRKIKIYRSEIQDTTIRLFAKKAGTRSKCPSCMKSSGSVRSSYVRALADLPLAANEVLVMLEVRRFACNNPACEKRIFSERCNNLTEPYSRRTIRASEYLKKFLIEISSNKGAYFSKIMNIPVSNNTCLRMVKSMRMPTNDKLNCIGIDDWAKRKGINYGTIIVNADTGRPIDLLDSRDSNDVVEWLSNHKEIKYVTRDRSTAYASAIKKAIPEAKQIADRFHLVKNLSDAVQEEIRQEYSYLRQVSKNIYAGNESKKSKIKPGEVILDAQYDASRSVEQEISSTMMVKREKLVQITKMKKNGHSISEIARKTQATWITVKRYLAHGIPSTSRSTQVNYNRYMAEIKHMCSLEINQSAMYRSLRDIGLKCCERSFTRWFNLNFRDYKHKWNRTYPEPLKVSKADIMNNFIPSPKKLSIFVTNPEYGVAKDTGECSKEKEVVDNLIKEVPLLFSLRKFHIDFRNILKGGCPNQLDIWIENVQSIGRKRMDSFCEGLKKDIMAIKNAIIYNWTNGLVEGNVNRLKNKKREMYGRCGFELLRRKVCLSQTG